MGITFSMSLVSGQFFGLITTTTRFQLGTSTKR